MSDHHENFSSPRPATITLPSSFMTSPFCLRTTPYGGRGLFSIEPIPKDTLLVTCNSPYATVIFRKFRKEVCGHCFAYAFDAHRNAWNVKYDGQAGNGVWFCGVDCRDVWAAEQNVEGLQGLMNAAVDKLAKSMKEPKVILPYFLETMRPEDITLEVHDLAWKRIEDMYSRPGCLAPYLDELEVDNVRFIVSAIVRRYFEDTVPVKKGSSSWSALLQLQNNEIQHIRSRPYMLDSHTRIYGFLRKVMLPILQPYVKTSEMVRAILARDQGNVFGLWDMSTTGDSEMLGWSMYVSGSYFNHDCAPNVRKERDKQALCFYTTRDVEAGEELCINYVDVKDEVAQRRAELSANWYFDCACKRCHEELARAGKAVACG
ncbi:putative protein lysine methyltransferase SET6 [Hypsizygus marmoreus]|uniref:SET domain-containing protein n=1 Tax=Hypsizygus marmoreus TaxID=39966 RepID=A0A369JUU8_HYPMA|nr:putative protein lysine methyltransferase SET6 [Hypsizygus marmoreus]